MFTVLKLEKNHENTIHSLLLLQLRLFFFFFKVSLSEHFHMSAFFVVFFSTEIDVIKCNIFQISFVFFFYIFFYYLIRRYTILLFYFLFSLSAYFTLNLQLLEKCARANPYTLYTVHLMMPCCTD